MLGTVWWCCLAERNEINWVFDSFNDFHLMSSIVSLEPKVRQLFPTFKSSNNYKLIIGF